jgi:hypothetical protein
LRARWSSILLKIEAVIDNAWLRPWKMFVDLCRYRLRNRNNIKVPIQKKPVKEPADSSEAAGGESQHLRSMENDMPPGSAPEYHQEEQRHEEGAGIAENNITVAFLEAPDPGE